MSVHDKDKPDGLVRESWFYRFSRRNFLKSLVQVCGGLALFWKGSLTSRKDRRKVDESFLPGIPLKKLPAKIPGPDPKLLG